MTRTPALSRRALMRAGLVIGGGSLVAGCGSRSSTPSDSPAADDDPDVLLLTAAIQDEANVLGLARATVARHRELADLVGPVVALQRAHVRDLSAGLSEPPDLDRSPPGDVPRSSAKALAAVTHAVSAAEAARLDDCLAATSGLLARLLASTSASHASTVETLRRTR